MSSRTSGEFTGRHMLFIMLAFFGVIIAVNVLMATFARTSWTGLVVENTYVASQEFNHKAAEGRAQAALHWKGRLSIAEGTVRYELADASGSRIAPRAVTVFFRHPAYEMQDRTIRLERAADGDPRCLLALEMESFRMKKHLGGYAAVLGGIDAVVFSAGAGEGEWLMREKVLDDMEHFGIRLDRERNRAARSVDREERISADDSAVAVFVIPTAEEMVYAEEVAALLNGAGG